MSQQEKIISMFNLIANKYDISSSIISFGIESMWKKQGAKVAIKHMQNMDKKIKIADIACGTGSMIGKWKDVLDKNNTDYEIVGIDPSSKMLDIAKEKFSDIEFFENKASNIPLEDNSVDIASIAYGVRNIVDINSSLNEIHRVLKPDGLLLVLEFFGNKDKSPISYLRDMYIKHIIPIVGGFISKNKKSFEYLSSSIESFDSPKDFEQKLIKCGFEITYTRGFSFNVSHCMVIKKTKNSNKNPTSKPSTISKAKPIMPFSRALKTVGMKCFVKYYAEFNLDKIHTKDIVDKMQKEEEYTKETCISRISNARFIIKNGYTKETLEHIIQANRTDAITKKKAKKILKDL